MEDKWKLDVTFMSKQMYLQAKLSQTEDVCPENPVKTL